MYIFKFPFMENTVGPHSEFVRYLLSCFPNHHHQTGSLCKDLAVLELVLWTRDFFASTF